MGLFVAGDGHYQGWLAALLCCCAAVNEDESPIELERERARAIEAEHTDAKAESMYSLQPMPRVELSTAMNAVYQASDNTGPSMPSSAFGTPSHTRYATPTSQDVGHSFLNVDLGPNFPFGYKGRTRRTVSLDNLQRPDTASSGSLRGSELIANKRQTLVPLRLRPVVLRDRPTSRDQNPMQLQPDTSKSLHLDADFMPTSSVNTNSNPILNSQLASHLQSSSSLAPAALPRPVFSSAQQHTPLQQDLQISFKPSLSSRSSSSSLRRDTSASSLMSKPSFERPRSRRMKSFQSLRRYTDEAEAELDNEILELNTIVEERRSDAVRTSPTDTHIPAIAPTMQVRARSETLSAIGSALSRPQSNFSQETVSQQRPAAPIPYSTVRNASRTRISGWLSSIWSSSASSSNYKDEPFYKCQIPAHVRAYSEGSFGPSFVETDSPSLTAASSPTMTTKGHSRSHTSDSYATHYATTYSSIADEPDLRQRYKVSEHSLRPIHVVPPSPDQVGVAL